MTNLDRARELIERVAGGIACDGDGDLTFIAGELHAAGLLAPDLPEANDPGLPYPIRSWALETENRPVVWTAPGCTVMIQRIEPGELTPDQARTFALNILAAVAYSEGTTP